MRYILNVHKNICGKRLLGVITFLICMLLLANGKNHTLQENLQDSVSGAVNKKGLPEYTTVKIPNGSILIDGHLNDSCWKVGTWAGDFIQWAPNEGAKASQPTFFKILYDDRNLYVAIRAIEPKVNEIQRKLSRRDVLSGDVVGVALDSYHDRRTSFEFSVTSAGQKVDAIDTNPSNTDPSWNAVWFTKTALEDSAWTAELAIPFSQLRYSKSSKQEWGLHCSRWINRLKEESDWDPQSVSGPGMLYLFGKLKGLENIPKSRPFEMMVSGLSKFCTFKKDRDNPFENKGYDWTHNVGLDAKIGLTSNFTADMTINPDFGQVEADPSEMNLTAFETFYDEKRPFFLEGKNIFAFDVDDVNLFYSRRIGHAPSYYPELGAGEYSKQPDNTTILDAVKVSGKTENGFTLGLLQSMTARENASISSEGSDYKAAVEPLTNYFVARVQQDFKQGNTILGGIFTSTNRFIRDQQLAGLNKNAFTGGLDLLHQWRDKEFYLDAKLMGSYINGDVQAIREQQLSSARYYQRPDISYAHYDSTATQLSGWGADVKIGKGSKGFWKYYTELSMRSPGLELNDMGYMQTSDIIRQRNYLAYAVNKPVSIFRTYSWALLEKNHWDYGLRYLSSAVMGAVYVEFLNKWNINNTLTYTSGALDMRLLRGGAAVRVPANWQESVTLKTDDSRNVSLSLGYTRILPNSQLSSSLYTTTITAHPFDFLKCSVTLNYACNKDELQYVAALQSGSNSDAILSRIDQQVLGATFRTDCSITPELSLQYYGSPFASTGHYSNFKRITDALNPSFNSRYTSLNTLSENVNGYLFDANGDGKSDFSVSNPDFNYNQFRSNFVVRWEYRPGSQLYFVWSNEITNYQTSGADKITSVFRNFTKGTVHNIFLVKLSYWFSL